MNPDERRILIKAQKILTMERDISQMFIDGMVGRSFSKSLAFYLDRSEEYLYTIEKLIDESVVCESIHVDQSSRITHDQWS